MADVPKQLPGESISEWHVRVQAHMAEMAEAESTGQGKKSYAGNLAHLPNRTQVKAAQIIGDCAISGEPVFIFRAKDIFSIMVIQDYLDRVDKYGNNTGELQEGIVQALQDFRDWQQKNTDRIRFPD